MGTIAVFKSPSTLPPTFRTSADSQNCWTRFIVLLMNTFASHWSPCFPAWLISLLAVMPLFASCSSGPSRIEPPSISASGSAQQAMKLYDTDGDGFLAETELEAVPGLKAAIATLDTDKDSKVSAEEIAERIRTWQSSQIGVARVLCSVTLNGQPLGDATVTFEPESFLGDQIQPGDGVTDAYGAAYPRIPKDKRPLPDMPPGLQLGFYRVKVSKPVGGKETIPAMYNTETTLGQQIAPDDPIMMSHKIQFKLKSR